MKIVYPPSGKALEYSPLACNLRRGCTHGCLYCYAPGVLRMAREDFHADSTLKDDALAKLEADCAGLAAKGDCRRILFEFASDPYQPGNLDRETRRALEIVKGHGLSFSVLTKGGLRATRDFDLYGPEDRFGQTVVLASEEAREQYEPGASPILHRSLAGQQAFDRGIYTWISVEPVVDAYHALRTIAEFSAWTREFRIGPLNHGPLPGLPIVSAGFVAEAVPLLQETGRRWVFKQSWFRRCAEELSLPYWGPTNDQAWQEEIGAPRTCCPKAPTRATCCRAVGG